MFYVKKALITTYAAFVSPQLDFIDVGTWYAVVQTESNNTRLYLGINYMHRHKFKYKSKDVVNPVCICNCGNDNESTEFVYSNAFRCTSLINDTLSWVL